MMNKIPGILGWVFGAGLLLMLGSKYSVGDFYDIDEQDVITMNVANNQVVIRKGGRDTAIIRARNVSDLEHHGNNIQRNARDRIIKIG